MAPARKWNGIQSGFIRTGLRSLVHWAFPPYNVPYMNNNLASPSSAIILSYVYWRIAKQCSSLSSLFVLIFEDKLSLLIFILMTLIYLIMMSTTNDIAADKIGVYSAKRLVDSRP